MSRKQPELRIVYPDASTAAMLLTEAMIKRSSGKRVVETESTEREYTGQELFAGALACKTDTSVELTLRLNPDAMDYALTTLIAKNLTEEERRAIRMETTSMEVVDLLSSAQAAEAPGQALDGGSSPDVPSAERETATQSGEQEKQIEVGKISDYTLRDILANMVCMLDHGAGGEEAIEEAVNTINYRAGVIETNLESDLIKQVATVLGIAERPLVTPDEVKSLEMFAKNLCAIIRAEEPKMQDTYLKIGDLRRELIHARYFGGADADQLYKDLPADINPNSNLPWSEYEAYELRENKEEKPPRRPPEEAQNRQKKTRKKKSAKNNDPSWEDVEKEAQSLGKNKTDKTDKTDDILPELLNDIDEDKSSTAKVGSAPLADEEGREE